MEQWAHEHRTHERSLVSEKERYGEIQVSKQAFFTLPHGVAALVRVRLFPADPMQGDRTQQKVGSKGGNGRSYPVDNPVRPKLATVQYE